MLNNLKIRMNAIFSARLRNFYVRRANVFPKPNDKENERYLVDILVPDSTNYIGEVNLNQKGKHQYANTIK